ncbi:MAG TPA: SDR family oxidoreductase [Steroidobacteraceae bacterium]|nr:SDR family oxidoreductase [Steroidobacteraceae bacterium]
MSATARYLVAGCGYVGTRLARALLPRGPVVGLTRSDTSAAELDAQGIDAVSWDLDSAEAPVPRGIGTASVIYYLIAPPPSGISDPRLKRFLAKLPTRPARLVYLSTTGVYGDTGGATVGEDAPLNPLTERAMRRVDAERVARDWSERHGVGWTILRVPGIYGPGRLPIERLKRREPMIRHSEAGYSSRIHVDDLVAACLLAGSAPRAVERIYNVSDGNPTSMTEYFERVATLTGLPPPELVTRAEAEKTLSPGLLSYLAESRRIDSSRIRDELGFAPRFKDLRLGILSSLPAL